MSESNPDEKAGGPHPAVPWAEYAIIPLSTRKRIDHALDEFQSDTGRYRITDFLVKAQEAGRLDSALLLIEGMVMSPQWANMPPENSANVDVTVSISDNITMLNQLYNSLDLKI